MEPRTFESPRFRDHYPPDLELEPIHLDIALSVDIDAHTITGTVTSSIKAKAGQVQTLRLHAVAFHDLQVADKDGRPVGVDYNGSEIAVTWREPFDVGEVRTLVVQYRVSNPSTGLFFSSPDKGYPKQSRFAATDHETERARHWLPCVDLPSVRPTLAFHIRADKDLTVAANGRHVEDTPHDDQTYTSHWALETGCPSYLTCFVVGEFQRVDDAPFGEVPIAYLTTREIAADDLRRSFGRTGEMLDWITKKLDCPYPFPKYFQCAVRGIGGAMENISLVRWDDRWVFNEPLAEELGWLV